MLSNNLILDYRFCHRKKKIEKPENNTDDSGRKPKSIDAILSAFICAWLVAGKKTFPMGAKVSGPQERLFKMAAKIMKRFSRGSQMFVPFLPGPSVPYFYSLCFITQILCITCL